VASETCTPGRPSEDREGHLGWVDASLLSLCAASTVVVVLGGLVQVSFGSFSMTLAEAWRAVFDPDVVFDPRVCEVLVLGGTLDASALLNPLAWDSLIVPADLPETNKRSLIAWNIRLPRVLIAVSRPFGPIVW